MKFDKNFAIIQKLCESGFKNIGNWVMKELSKQVKALWGKKSNVDGQELWQPLVVHL